MASDTCGQILCSDWLSERVRWNDLPARGCPLRSRADKTLRGADLQSLSFLDKVGDAVAKRGIRPYMYVDTVQSRYTFITSRLTMLYQI